jgi:hypothetical protein
MGTSTTQKKESASLQKSRKLAQIEAEVRDYQVQNMQILKRISFLRQELANSEDPELILDEFAEIIRSFNIQPDIQGIISESLVSSLLNFETPEQSFEWLSKNHQLLKTSLDSIKSTQEQTLYQEFFEKLILKYTINNRTEDLIEASSTLPTQEDRDSILRQIAPSLVMADGDPGLLSQIKNQELRSQAARDVIVGLDRRAYNRTEAINRYLDKDYEIINDTDGTILSTIFSEVWYRKNQSELEMMIEKSTSESNRERLLVQMAKYSSNAGDGFHDKWLNLIKDKSSPPNSEKSQEQ